LKTQNNFQLRFLRIKKALQSLAEYGIEPLFQLFTKEQFNE
jgi:hypothetical protein